MPRQLNYIIPDVYDAMLKALGRKWDTNQTQTHLRCIELAYRMAEEKEADTDNKEEAA